MNFNIFCFQEHASTSRCYHMLATGDETIFHQPLRLRKEGNMQYTNLDTCLPHYLLKIHLNFQQILHYNFVSTTWKFIAISKCNSSLPKKKPPGARCIQLSDSHWHRRVILRPSGRKWWPSIFGGREIEGTTVTIRHEKAFEESL